jgi:hypothetical protein
MAEELDFYFYFLFFSADASILSVDYSYFGTDI